MNYLIRRTVLLLVWGTLLTGCTQSSIIEELTPEEPAGVLRFGLTMGQAETATRAAESDNAILQKASAYDPIKGNHIRIATYTGTPGSSLEPYFSDELGYQSGSWLINSGKTRFLPNRPMHLYAYFATDVGDAGQVDNGTITYNVPSSTSYPSLTFTTGSDAFEQLDLIAAKVENISQSNVTIPFRHILSQINFGVRGIDDHTVTVKNITLKGIIGKGSFDYNSWKWTPDITVAHSYPYHFPDGKGRSMGNAYATAGTPDDSNNTYLFGDGGKFGPGNADTFLYAQTNPTQTMYATQADAIISGNLSRNSLMLLPQEITRNLSATVFFDYEIKKNGILVQSATGKEIALYDYYDWKPNLRYVYVLNFDAPTDKISFNVLIDEWKNWDSSGSNTGVMNGSIQEPTRSTLNSTSDDETIYLLGLLERNLTWNWSNATLYTFDRINTLTLDFSGVEMKNYSVDVKVPSGFTLTGANPVTAGGKLILTRNDKILLKPTERQLNAAKASDALTLYGTLAANQSWNWQTIAFASLKQNESFKLDFSTVSFGGNAITLTLPTGMIATGIGVSGSNPYTLSEAAEITISNQRVDIVKAPLQAILDVVSDRTGVRINGGNVAAGGDTWDWSSYTFSNLDPQESFDLIFSGVTFGGESISLKLPTGFRASSSTVTGDGTVTVKNNKILYPTASRVNALSDGAVITLVGETLTSDADLNWNNTFTFPNLPAQAAFTLDASGGDFSNKQLMLTLPSYFALSVSGMAVSNPYLFPATGASVVVRNDKIQRPTNDQLNNTVNGSRIVMTNGRLFANEQWDWSTLPFTSLGRLGSRFTLAMSGITLAPYTLSLKLPPNCVATGPNVEPQGNGIFKITNGTGDVVIVDHRFILPTDAVLNALSPSGQISIDGKGLTLQESDIWDWTNLTFPNFAGTGQYFDLTLSNINFNGKAITIKLPGFAVAKVSGSGAVSGSNGSYTLTGTGVFRLTDNSMPFNDTTIKGAANLTNGQTLTFSGQIIQKTNHSVSIANAFALTRPGESIYLDFRRTQYFIGTTAAETYIEIWNSDYLNGYSVTSANPGGKASIHSNGNTIIVNAPCMVIITKN